LEVVRRNPVPVSMRKANILAMILWSTFMSDNRQTDPHDNGSLSFCLNRVIVAKQRLGKYVFL
jgi:hypothetical protein